MENINDEDNYQEPNFWNGYNADTLPPLPEISEENKIILKELESNHNRNLPFYGIIYLITSPENKKYVGQTTNWKLRYESYSSYKCFKQKHLLNALNSYKIENMKIEILNFANNQDELNELESYYEIKFNTLSSNGCGYNIRRCGGSKGKHSEETKKLMSLAKQGPKNWMYGKIFTESHIQKLQEAQKGEKHWTFGLKTEEHPRYGRSPSETTKQKISEANSGENHPNFGRQLSEEHKKNIGLALKGRELSPEHRKQISERQIGEKNHMWGYVYTDEERKRVSEQVKGKNHPRLDNKEYKFFHAKNNETFTGIQYDFYTSKNLCKKGVNALIKGKSKSCHGWTIINSTEK